MRTTRCSIRRCRESGWRFRACARVRRTSRHGRSSPPRLRCSRALPAPSARTGPTAPTPAETPTAAAVLAPSCSTSRREPVAAMASLPPRFGANRHHRNKVRASRSIVDPVETYVAPVTLVKSVTNAIAGLADGALAKVGVYRASPLAAAFPPTDATGRDSGPIRHAAYPSESTLFDETANCFPPGGLAAAQGYYSRSHDLPNRPFHGNYIQTRFLPVAICRAGIYFRRKRRPGTDEWNLPPFFSPSPS